MGRPHLFVVAKLDLSGLTGAKKGNATGAAGRTRTPSVFIGANNIRVVDP